MIHAFSNALLGAVALSAAVIAVDPHVGKVVSAGSGKITISTDAGRQESYEVAADAVIMLNNQLSKLEKLSMGDEAKLTVETKDSKQVVTMVDAKSSKDKSPGAAP